MVDDGQNRWTIRQAANWIRYRSESRLDASSEAEQPHEVHARRLLQHELASGSLVAHGKDTLLSKGFWKGAAFFDRGNGARTLYSSWEGLTVPAETCKRLWPSAAELIGTGIPLRAFLEKFGFDAVSKSVSPEATWLLTSDTICVTGLNAAGERVDVDRPTLNECIVDGVNSTIATHDGAIRWVGVQLMALAAEPMPAPPVKKVAAGEPVDVERPTLDECIVDGVDSTITSPDGALRSVSVQIMPRRAEGERQPAPAVGDEMKMHDLNSAATAIVSSIQSDGRRMSRATFAAMVQELAGEALSTKTVDEMWRCVSPPAWQTPSPGAPKKGTMIVDWHKYAPMK